jgi:hypothetical protein
MAHEHILTKQVSEQSSIHRVCAAEPDSLTGEKKSTAVDDFKLRKNKNKI